MEPQVSAIEWFDYINLYTWLMKIGDLLHPLFSFFHHFVFGKDYVYLYLSWMKYLASDDTNVNGLRMHVIAKLNACVLNPFKYLFTKLVYIFCAWFGTIRHKFQKRVLIGEE